ncbi:oligosaccharide flippase family protein [Pontibacter actiniarum]|uniref:Polysaccharide biosynthesis protein n=1 Tax=Pontibacter actiniarum TaxID=323450 RepID=A0A1X9YMQ2_9BACT|nr:oligosaccharide flippase family protein [Pontibacter actiniarum]ARS34127.1 polysaccharide biosynthesis protein [Pontibacter actiniarum]
MTENTVKKAPKKKENLKQRAYLNSVTSIIDYGGAQITGFIVSPFIVNGLGSAVYGIWQMLTQMTGYAGMADTRATQVLKWSIANKRGVAEKEELRSDVTTALVVTCLILPLVLITGGIIVWYAPVITKADAEYHSIIRMACSFLVLSLVINKVFNLFESVLRGMNLGFKRMGLRAGIVAVGGGLKVLAITQGFGLVGLSMVEVFTAVITGASFYYIVKQSIGWFGFGKTNMSKVVSYGKLSGWFMAYTGSKMFLLHSDKILLGYLAGPVFVTKYAITMFTSNAIQGFVNAVVNGIIPGIGGLFGKQEYDKVIKARRIVVTLNWLLITSLGVAVLLLNRTFIALWVGVDHYAGTLENLLILYVSIQAIFFQIDSLIINVTLNMKKKVLFSVLASAVTILLAYTLVDDHYIIGLSCSVLVGRFILTVGYPLILKERMQDNSRILTRQKIQPFVISTLMLAGAAYLSQWVELAGWYHLFTAGFVVVLSAGLVFWFAGIGQYERQEAWGVLSQVKLLKKDK